MQKFEMQSKHVLHSFDVRLSLEEAQAEMAAKLWVISDALSAHLIFSTSFKTCNFALFQADDGVDATLFDPECSKWHYIFTKVLN